MVNLQSNPRHHTGNGIHRKLNCLRSLRPFSKAWKHARSPQGCLHTTAQARNMQGAGVACTGQSSHVRRGKERLGHAQERTAEPSTEMETRGASATWILMTEDPGGRVL